MKCQIRDKLTQSLGASILFSFDTNTKCFQTTADVTGQEGVIIHWIRFKEKVVLHYGVDLVGYTYEKIVNPSELSSALEPLQELLDALKNGTCKFVKLTNEQRKERQEAFNAKMNTGEITTQKRKRRSDAGEKRSGAKRKRKNDENANPSTSAHYKSAETVESD